MGRVWAPRAAYVTLTRRGSSAGPAEDGSPRTFPTRSVPAPVQPRDEPSRAAGSALRRLAHRLAPRSRRAAAPGHRPSQPQGTQAPLPCAKHRSCWELVGPGMCPELCPLSLAAHPGCAPQRGRVPACPGAHHTTSQQETAGDSRAVTLQAAAHLSRGKFCPCHGKTPSAEDRAGYEHTAVNHVLPLSAAGLWRPRS